jgi:hypothetical protein
MIHAAFYTTTSSLPFVGSKLLFRTFHIRYVLFSFVPTTFQCNVLVSCSVLVTRIVLNQRHFQLLYTALAVLDANTCLHELALCAGLHRKSVIVLEVHERDIGDDQGAADGLGEDSTDSPVTRPDCAAVALGHDECPVDTGWVSGIRPNLAAREEALV